MAEKQYYTRVIDSLLSEWAQSEVHKPVLLRGARQVGKSSAVRHLALQFKYFIEMNFEKEPSLKTLFSKDIDIQRICEDVSASYGMPVKEGETLLFLDEIQDCADAIRALRYFYEEKPGLHVIAAGSLLEFTLAELPTFAVGRIRSMFMYPFSFYEFLGVVGNSQLQHIITHKTDFEPLSGIVHEKLLQHYRTFLLLGGMPEVVATWQNTHNYAACTAVHEDILTSYMLDFAKYKTRVPSLTLQQVLISVARQAGQKFVYSQAAPEIEKVKESLSLLSMAGLIIPVTHTAANGLPLGAETNEKFRKFLMMDTGLMLHLSGLNLGELVLLDTASLVNKGGLAEVAAGLELQKAASSTSRTELFYWQNLKPGAQAEIDYLTIRQGEMIPVEVKAGSRGSMKSMYYFLDLKQLPYGIRTSMENYGSMEKIRIVPLYAIGQI